MTRLQDALGLELPDERLEEEFAAFADIAAAIRKLRTLDLTEVHPVVVFDPTLPYRAARA